MSILSIVILTYNNQALLDDCIKSIDQQSIPVPYEKVVVDNGSTQPPDVPEGWRWVWYKENAGVVGGVNRCFAEARNPWVLFVSNDVRYEDPSAVWSLFDVAHRSSTQAMPMVMKPDGSIDCCGMDIVWPGYGIGRRKWKAETTDVVPNITFLMHKKLWEDAGRFDEHIVMGYEDVDFALRLKGRKIVVRNSRAMHLGNQTLGKTLQQHRKVYRQSRYYVTKKHYGVGLRLFAMKVVDFIRAIPLLNNVRV